MPPREKAASGSRSTTRASYLYRSFLADSRHPAPRQGEPDRRAPPRLTWREVPRTVVRVRFASTFREVWLRCVSLCWLPGASSGVYEAARDQPRRQGPSLQWIESGSCPHPRWRLLGRLAILQNPCSPEAVVSPTHSHAILLAALLGPLAACSPATDTACTTDVRQGIEVEIRDSVSDAPIASLARGAAIAGAYVDSLRPARGEGTGALLSLAGAPERPGTYAVTVEVPGYHTWTQSNVLVQAGVCHVKAVSLLARLQSAP
jgi:hypothetical protein